MLKKIVLDAGHGKGLAGHQTPDGIDEWTLNHKVALAVAKQLAAYEVEISRVDDTTGKTDVSPMERLSKTNKIMPDAFISIHHHVYTGKWDTHTGIEVYYNPSRENDDEKALANEIAANIATYTGLKNRGTKRTTYTVLTVDTNILALLTRGGFMDSTVDHPVITSEKGQEAYARGISDALIKHLKLTKKCNDHQDKDASIAKVKIGNAYTLGTHLPGFHTATDAKAGRNQQVTVLAGTYTISSLSEGMINLTKMNEQPGVWINPN